jgi:hypothetical protein
MLSMQAIGEKRHQKAAKRKKLAAWRRRLLVQYGPMMGQHIYDKARAKAAGRDVPTRKPAWRKPEAPAPIPTAPQAKPSQKDGLFRRFFHRVVP